MLHASMFVVIQPCTKPVDPSMCPKHAIPQHVSLPFLSLGPIHFVTQCCVCCRQSMLTISQQQRAGRRSPPLERWTTTADLLGRFREHSQPVPSRGVVCTSLPFRKLDSGKCILFCPRVRLNLASSFKFRMERDIKAWHCEIASVGIFVIRQSWNRAWQTNDTPLGEAFWLEVNLIWTIALNLSTQP